MLAWWLNACPDERALIDRAMRAMTRRIEPPRMAGPERYYAVDIGPALRAAADIVREFRPQAPDILRTSTERGSKPLCGSAQGRVGREIGSRP